MRVFHVECHLVDVWNSLEPDQSFRFAIIRKPDSNCESTGLFYVNSRAGERGPLLSTASSKWQTPPYRFPALFFIPLNTGATLWIRLNQADELRIVYKKGQCHDGSSFWRHIA